MLPLVIRGIAWPRNTTLLGLGFVLYDLPKRKKKSTFNRKQSLGRRKVCQTRRLMSNVESASQFNHKLCE